MDEIMSILYHAYITPNIEDDEFLKYTSSFYQELKPLQMDQCGRVLQLCASKAFLLGVRTGARVERFLGRDAPNETNRPL